MCCSKSWTMIAAVLGCLGVIFGAFAAHGLDGVLLERYPADQQKEIAGQTFQASWKYLQDFKTAAEYQMYHALALLAVGIMSARQSKHSLQIAGYSFLFGTILFSGSLYVLVLTGKTWLGAVTPFGGALFIVGWIALAVAVCPCGSSAATSTE